MIIGKICFYFSYSLPFAFLQTCISFEVRKRMWRKCKQINKWRRFSTCGGPFSPSVNGSSGPQAVLSLEKLGRRQGCKTSDGLCRRQLTVNGPSSYPGALTPTGCRRHAGVSSRKRAMHALFCSCFKAHGNFLWQKNASSLGISEYFEKHISLPKKGWRASDQGAL